MIKFKNMRYNFLVLLVICVLVSCKDSKKEVLIDSSGKINDISVVIDNENWNGNVGEVLRQVLAAPIYGLPQDEPLFIINQIPSNVFTGFITKNRTVLIVKSGAKPNISFEKNVYAQPQRVIVISGKTEEDIIKLINDNSSKIVSYFRTIELKEKQRLIVKSLKNDDDIEDNLGLSIRFPSAYRISKTLAKKEDKFYWLKRDTRTGYLNILLYELPLTAIKKDSNIIGQVIKIRDSIGKKYISGPVDHSYLMTEDTYTPFHIQTKLDNKPTLETKGIWKVKNAVMAGPFINYAIEDKNNKRWIIAEGFAFAPSVEKRDYIFELEAIIKSIVIKK